jgi:LEA14-like dessication related protein
MSENVILSMSMIVNNRNSIDAKVTNSDFDVSINGTFLGKGKLDVPFVLQADKVSEIKGEVSTTYSNFMKSGVNILGTLLSNNKVLYKASGTIEVIVTDFNINVSVPFEIENNLTISVQ